MLTETFWTALPFLLGHVLGLALAYGLFALWYLRRGRGRKENTKPSRLPLP